MNYALACFRILHSLGKCAEEPLLVPWVWQTRGLFSAFSSSLLSSSESLLLSSLPLWPSTKEPYIEKKKTTYLIQFNFA